MAQSAAWGEHAAVIRRQLPGWWSRILGVLCGASSGGEPGLMAFSLVTFALVVGPGNGVGAQGGEGEAEHGSLEPPVACVDVLALMEVPGLLVIGARPAYEASWASVVKVPPRGLGKEDGGGLPGLARCLLGPGDALP